MRNIFDQYEQPENRLSHALAVCLNEDRDLLRAFLRWIDCRPPQGALSRLVVVEQRLPGDPPEIELDGEQRGLPDIVIHDADSWCVLIESKVQAPLEQGQLLRHESTLGRRGFKKICTVVLTKAGSSTKNTIGLTWSGLYEWLGAAKGREWPDRLRVYLRAAEVRLARQGYLTEGTLTMFDGFPFSHETPYTYGEAKRLLKLAMDELRTDRSLIKLGMDKTAPGRGAITGRGGDAVWDFLSLRERPDGPFTAYPHLTLAINTKGVNVAITVPHGVVRPVRQRLMTLEVDGLIALNREIMRGARPLLRQGAWIDAYALQRHYPSQRSAGIMDARLSFKLETSLAKGGGRVKPQLEWVTVFSQLLRNKRSNIQFGYVVNLPWTTEGLDRRDSLAMIAESWCALKPLLEVVRAN